MDRQHLIHALEGTLVKTKVPQLAGIGQSRQWPVPLFLDLCFYEPVPAIAFRAAWILEYIAVHDTNRFLEVFEAFIHRFPKQQNPSCQRHFSKILLAFTSPKAPGAYQEVFARLPDHEILIETLFGWLIGLATPVAVKVNCMEALCHLRHEFPWISQELREHILYELRDGSAAMQARGKKVLNLLGATRSDAG